MIATPIIILLILSILSISPALATIDSETLAGGRNSIYGNPNQGDNDFWISEAQQMSAKFPGSTPGHVIVIGYTTGVNTYLQFPKPAGSYPNVDFAGSDAIEPMLDAYDDYGLKVYLQVESANADVPMLMDLIMNRYKHHPSVIGFGVDAEWYHEAEVQDGRALTNNEVNSWASQVKTYNPSYKLMVKHWEYGQLSNARPNNVLFLTDSEQIGSHSSAIAEYIDWIDHFGTSEVGFQIGYPSDQSWWSNLNDPAKDLIQPVLDARPNANIGAIFWVDFSVHDVFNKQSIGQPCAPNCNYDQPSDPDTDNDGFPDSLDSCPTQPETYNDYLDGDGCPDTPPPVNQDTDADGIFDSVDSCPTQKETFNGYLDGDGCPDIIPDLDADNDGIPDNEDSCPTQPETYNGYQDVDGCPDVDPTPDIDPFGDDDGDGILNGNDSCPTSKETINGYRDFDGCPDNVPVMNDMDNDGISDETDQCPTQPETINGHIDADGCPDTAPDITSPALPTLIITEALDGLTNPASVSVQSTFTTLDYVLIIIAIMILAYLLYRVFGKKNKRKIRKFRY